MNKEEKKQLDELSRFINDNCNLLRLFPHYEFDHILVELYNPEIFSTDIFRVIQFKVGMN
jgi:hypothetical protein